MPDQTYRPKLGPRRRKALVRGPGDQLISSLFYKQGGLELAPPGTKGQGEGTEPGKVESGRDQVTYRPAVEPEPGPRDHHLAID